MLYLLDTNAFSALMRSDEQMVAGLSSIGGDDRVVICTITRGEILLGLEKLSEGRRTDLETKAANLFAVLPCEPIPPAAGDLYAKVKAARQRLGVALDENDGNQIVGKIRERANTIGTDVTRGAYQADFLALLPLLWAVPFGLTLRNFLF